MSRIGELLVAEGLLSEAVIQRALGFQRVSGERIRIGSILLNWDLLAEEALLATLAKFHRCPAIDWPTLAAAPFDVVRRLTPAQAARFAAIPFALEGTALRVALVGPSDLAAIDEISAITGKRVQPCVTTEVRLLQAHHKFYGRHIPGTIRNIAQKLDRKTGQARRFTAIQPLDFRAPDLASDARRASVPVPIGPDFESLSPPDLPSIGPGATSADESLTTLLGELTPPPIRVADLPSATAAPAQREDPIHSGEDSLSAWVDDALTAFQQDCAGGSATAANRNRPPASARPPAAQRPPAPLGLSSSPRRSASAPAAPSPEEVASSMWHPSPIDRSDESADGMWTAGEEIGPQLWEARSRAEIGDALLQNAVTHLPRVLLFGAGRASITGWRGRAPGLAPEQIETVRISASRPSVFSTVAQTSVPHFGPVDQADWPAELAPVLGADPPDCAIFPIRVLDGIAALLYADRLGSPMQYADFALVARAAASTASVLSRFLIHPESLTVDG